MSNKKLFESKEHYLEFRAAWGKAVNDARAKSIIVPCNEYFYNKWTGKSSVSEGTGRERKSGWITASHVVLYNLLRDNPIYRGFTAINKKSRMDNGHLANHGLYNAYMELTYEISKSAFVLETDAKKDKFLKSREDKWKIKSAEQYRGPIIEFLEPFDGTIDIEFLTKVEVPKIKPLYKSSIPDYMKEYSMEDLVPYMIREAA